MIQRMGMAAAIAVGYLANIPPKELAENVHDWLALAFSVLGGSP